MTGGQATRPFRGVYLASGAVDELSLLRAALAQLGDEAVAVLGSAAIARGLEGLPRRWTPQVAMPRGLERAQREGMDLHFWTIPAAQVEIVDDIPVTSVVRTLADVCRLLTREQADCLVDSALNRGLIVPDALQVPRRDRDGRLLGYADLGYRLAESEWLLVEFDGRSIHERPEALLADRHRQNAILSAGSDRMVRFAWEDTLSPETIPAVVRPILESAGWRPSPAPPC